MQLGAWGRQENGEYLAEQAASEVGTRAVYNDRTNALDKELSSTLDEAQRLNEELFKTNAGDNELLIYRGQILVRRGRAGEANVQRILDSALAVFSAYGFRGARIDQIARA